MLEDGYSDKSIEIATYLTTFARPPHLSTKKFLKFKKKTWRFKIENRRLFRKNNKNVPIKRVVNQKKNQKLCVPCMMKLAIKNEKKRTAKWPVDTNETICTKTSNAMLKPAQNVNIVIQLVLKRTFTLPGRMPCLPKSLWT